LPWRIARTIARSIATTELMCAQALDLRNWLAALDDFRNWLIREAA
jgi:hypothetical protein